MVRKESECEMSSWLVQRKIMMKNIFINIVNAMCILRRETFVFDLNEFYNKLILASLQYNTIQYNTILYYTAMPLINKTLILDVITNSHNCSISRFRLTYGKEK